MGKIIMKHFLLIVAILLLASKGFAQTETTVWNGKTYYVYPHQLELQNNMYIFMQYAEFREVLKRDDNNQKVIRTEIKKIEEEDKVDMYGYGIEKKKKKKTKKTQKKTRPPKKKKKSGEKNGFDICGARKKKKKTKEKKGKKGFFFVFFWFHAV